MVYLLSIISHMDNSVEKLIKKIPKAELHLHIEGTLESEMMLSLAKRNNFELKYRDAEEAKRAYNFSNLQEFLDIYYEGAGVLLQEEDFYDLMIAYLSRAKDENIIHTEIFFDPQTHTSRGVKFSTVITGIRNGLVEGERRWGISSKLIMSYLRHLDEKDAFKTLEEALKYKGWITAVGLDSSEVGHPPSKFRGVFERSAREGFLTVAHAGEEGPLEYVKEAIEVLGIARIDHGNASHRDREFLKKLSEMKMPLTLCPLSNLKLGVVKNLREHPLKIFLDAGVMATVNSDDPAYFGGYLNDNYIAVAESLSLNESHIKKLAVNSIEASFLSKAEKNALLERIG